MSALLFTRFNPIRQVAPRLASFFVIFSAISIRLQRFDAVDRATGSGACGLEKTGCRRVGDSGVTGTLKGSLSLYWLSIFELQTHNCRYLIFKVNSGEFSCQGPLVNELRQSSFC